jgi:hypothetical protein
MPLSAVAATARNVHFRIATPYAGVTDPTTNPDKDQNHESSYFPFRQG